MTRVRGFTLLELLVAVALLALLGVTAALTLSSTLENGAQVSDRIEQLQRLQRAHTLIRRDLEQIVNRRGRTEQGDPRDQPLVANASASDDREGVLLDFYKSGRRILSRTPPSAHLERVRYRFSGGQLIRESALYPDSPDPERWHGGVLIDQVQEAAVQVYTQAQWSRQWPPLSAAPDATAASLPRAITLLLNIDPFGAVPLSVLLPEPL